MGGDTKTRSVGDIYLGHAQTPTRPQQHEHYRFLFFAARVVLEAAGGLPRFLPGFDRCLVVGLGDADGAGEGSRISTSSTSA